MRLIDADDRKLRTDLAYYTCWTGIDEAPYLFAVDVLDKATTVDAIPIAWIENWMYGLYFGNSDEVCKKLIADWRKDNGIIRVADNS